MARQKSELLSALGTVFEIVKTIVDGVLNLGGNDEDVRKILKYPDLRRKVAKLLLGVVRPTFKVVMDCGESLAEMISAGCYSWKNSNITPDHFPVKGRGRQEVELVLFDFNKAMTSKQVIAKMNKAGYRPAKIEELLALGAGQPKLQKQFPVVGLGSLWRGPHGHRYVPFLYWCSRGRCLDLGWGGGGWSEGYRFAGLRK